MSHDITPADARHALDAIDLRTRQVIEQVSMPAWYWATVALGWIAVGLVADLDHPWATLAATVVFGAGHGVIFQRVHTGRHGSPQLSVRHDRVDRHIPALVVSYLVLLGAATVGLALLANADGAGHPVTWASLVVAVAVFFGGQTLMSAVRARLARRVEP